MDSSFLPLARYPILVTRPRYEHCVLTNKLQAAGANVLSWPLIETHPIPFTFPNAIQNCQGVFFSSQNAIHSFFSKGDAKHWLATNREHVALFAVGKETAEAIRQYTAQFVHVPDVFDSLVAVNQWFQQGLWQAGNTILWPCGNLANSELMNWATQHQVLISPLPVYETRTVLLSSIERRALQADVQYAKCWVFSSPSAIEAFVSLVDTSSIAEQPDIACLSARTADVARRLLGRCNIVAEVNTMAGLYQAIIDYYENQPHQVIQALEKGD